MTVVTDERGPLHGVRVLDLSRFMAGPYAGQLLAYLGAEVVKIEEPGAGDPMRGLSKYSADGLSAHFQAGNASKLSVTLDLRKQEGRDLFLDLVRKSDVVLENFRLGVMARLGLDPGVLRSANPAIILASVTGFGQTGPWKNWPAYDLIAQAAGGGMSLTGWPGERPVKMGVPIGDVAAGIFAALGVVSALFRRAQTGQTDAVDVSMMDVQLNLLNYNAHYFWISGNSPEPEGDGHPNIVPYQPFETASGPLVVAVYGDPFWPGFCRALEVPDLIEDPRFATNAGRNANKDELLSILKTRFKTHEREFWIERLVSEGVPTGPLNSVGDAVNSAQAIAREMVVSVTTKQGRGLRLLGNPVKLAAGSPRPSMPPSLGEHTEKVLGELLGLNGDRLEALRGAKVI